MPRQEPRYARFPRAGLVTGVAWAVLVLGMWFWGRGVVVGSGGVSAPMTGDVAAVGRPPGVPLPPASAPLGAPLRTPASVAARPPLRVEVPSIGVAAPVMARGLDASGGVDPPPYGKPDTVGWYEGGAQPGAVGAAILVGHVDTTEEPAVFYGLSAVKPGEKVRVTRADGRIAEFTVDDVRVFDRARFDARKVYGQHKKSRAELRLITCGGTFDRRTHAYTANVVVSAYLSGVTAPRAS
ncbi:class F sortase [Streptomyces sp. NPDC088554]|uniref:class F sortase n=1 Tax=Streptomyces sp. NPDC088554 TaxID=3365865 RepID=UPI0037F244E5